jgi:hypothetical protein
MCDYCDINISIILYIKIDSILRIYSNVIRDKQTKSLSIVRKEKNAIRDETLEITLRYYVYPRLRTKCVSQFKFKTPYKLFSSKHLCRTTIIIFLLNLLEKM